MEYSLKKTVSFQTIDEANVVKLEDLPINGEKAVKIDKSAIPTSISALKTESKHDNSIAVSSNAAILNAERDDFQSSRPEKYADSLTCNSVSVVATVPIVCKSEHVAPKAIPSSNSNAILSQATTNDDDESVASVESDASSVTLVAPWAKFPGSTSCPRCRAAIGSSLTFCTNCGLKLKGSFDDSIKGKTVIRRANQPASISTVEGIASTKKGIKEKENSIKNKGITKGLQPRGKVTSQSATAANTSTSKAAPAKGADDKGKGKQSDLQVNMDGQTNHVIRDEQRLRSNDDILTVSSENSSLPVEGEPAVPSSHRAVRASGEHYYDPDNDPNQKDLQNLPQQVVGALNSLLTHLRDPRRDSERKHNEVRQEYLVTALELEAALHIEDHYMNVPLNSKLGPNPTKVKHKNGAILPEYFKDHSDRAAWNEAENLRLNARSVSEDPITTAARFTMLDTSSTGGSFGSTADLVDYSKGSIRTMEDIQLLDGSDGSFSTSNCIFTGVFQSETVLKQVQDRVQSNSDMRRANSWARPSTLRELQHDYRKKDKTLPALIYSSTLIHESIPMPPQIKPVVEPMKSKHEKKLETLALQKRYQTVRQKGIPQQQAVPITPSGTIVVAEDWRHSAVKLGHSLGDKKTDNKMRMVRHPMKTYSYVTTYLDEVGSVSEYYEEYKQREKDLYGLNAAVFGSTVSTIEETSLKTQSQDISRIGSVTKDSSMSKFGTIGASPIFQAKGSLKAIGSRQGELAEANANINKLFDQAIENEQQKFKMKRTEQKVQSLVAEMDREGVTPAVLSGQTSLQLNMDESETPEEKDISEQISETHLLQDNDKSMFWGHINDKSRFFVPRLPQDENGFVELYGANLSDSDEEPEEEHQEGRGYGPKAKLLDRLAVKRRAAAGFTEDDEAEYQEKLALERLAALTDEEKKGIAERQAAGFTREDEEEYQKKLGLEKLANQTKPKRLQGMDERTSKFHSIAQVDKLNTVHTPMLWTQVLHPDGMRSFQEDVEAGLERPLTPEPTSDDEDAAFEAEMEAMNKNNASGIANSPANMTSSHVGSQPSSKVGSKPVSKVASANSSKLNSRSTSPVGGVGGSLRIATSPENTFQPISLGLSSHPTSRGNSRSSSPIPGEMSGNILRSKDTAASIQLAADDSTVGDMSINSASNTMDGTDLQSLPTIHTDGTEADDNDEILESDAVIEARRKERKLRVARLRRQRLFEEVYEPTSPAAKLVAARHKAALERAEAEAAALRTPPKSATELQIEKLMAEGEEENKENSSDSDSDHEQKSKSSHTVASQRTGVTSKTEESDMSTGPLGVLPPGQLLPIFRQHPDPAIEHENAKLLVSGLPAEQGYAIMSRLFKRSVVRLRNCVKEPNLIRLIDDPCGPSLDDWSTAIVAMRNFQRMLTVVDEALDLAPKADATARREFVAYQQVLARKRTESATKVADFMKNMAEYHKTFNRKHDDMIDAIQNAPEFKQQRLRNQLETLKTKSEAELQQKGLKLMELQGKEAETAAYVRGLETTAVRIIQQWRPLHANMIQKTRLVQFRLLALIRTIAVRIIQRTARRRLLMYCRGQPETDEEFVERMQRQKQQLYSQIKVSNAVKLPW